MTQTPIELAMPHFEDRLSGELAQLHDEEQQRPTPGPSRRPRQREPWRRRAPLLAGIGAVAATAAIVAAITGTDPADRDDAPDVMLSADEVVAKVNAATAALPADTIVHWTYPYSYNNGIGAWTEDENGKAWIDPPGDGPWIEPVVTSYREMWTDPVTAATRSRYLDADGNVIADSGWPEAPGLDEQPDPDLVQPQEPVVGQCDPQVGMMVDDDGNLTTCVPPGGLPPDPPLHPARQVDYCRGVWRETEEMLIKQGPTAYQFLVDNGVFVLDGTEEFEGRELLRINNQDGDPLALVDPETWLTVRTTMDGEWTTWEYLPRTEENLAILAVPVPDNFTQVTESDQEFIAFPQAWSGPCR